MPPVLAIQLKRFEHHTATSKKLDDAVDFPLRLRMRDWIAESPFNLVQLDTVYRLFAVVNHSGTMTTGHYVSYIHCAEEWYRFDDHMVTVASEEEVLASSA